MTTKIWNGGSDNWASPGDWSPSGDPGAGNAVEITSGDPQITGNVGTVASVFDSAELTLLAGALTVSGSFTVSAPGSIQIDPYNLGGGSSLTIDGALMNSGTIDMGPSNNSGTAPTTVKVARVFNLIGESLGAINLYGSSSRLTKLSVGSAAGFGGADGIVYGGVNLSGDALVEFTGGEISKIAAQSEISLTGAKAVIADASNLSTDSALTGLTTIAGGLYLYNGASATLTGPVTNSGAIVLDQYNQDGGAMLTIRRALTNSGTVSIGPSNNSNTAATTMKVASLDNYIGQTLGTVTIYGNPSGGFLSQLDIGGSAGFGVAKEVVGNVNLFGDARIEFTGGQISTIASHSELSLTDLGAVVADVSGLSTNSALKGLRTILGGLYLYDGAAVTTSGPLANKGSLVLDQYNQNGGAAMTIGGGLTNTGTVSIGPDNDTLSAASTIHAASITNFVQQSYGTIDIAGNDSPSLIAPIPATLDIAGSAGFGVAGVLKGNVNLSYDAVLEFGGGEIKTIAGKSELSLTDAGAVVADASNLSSNSALKGLKTIYGGLNLYNGASVTTSGALANKGQLVLDQYNQNGGAMLTVHGALTNTGTVTIGPDNDTLSAASTIRAASIVNFVGKTYGAIDIAGNDSPSLIAPIPATLDIAGNAGFGVGGFLEGSVNLSYDAVLEFGGGQINTIAAKSELSLTDRGAVVADASHLSSNSALMGLKTVNGGLYLYNGASVTTSAYLTNAGNLFLDQYNGDGGSKLTVGGALTNKGTVAIGPDNATLSATSTIKAKSLFNHGTIDLYGNAQFHGVLQVAGAVVNDGSISINGDVESLVGAIDGKGSFAFTDSTLDFGSGVASGQTIDFGADDTMKLAKAANFDGLIADIVSGDHIVMTGFGAGTDLALKDAGGVSTLTLTDHSLVAHLKFEGDFKLGDFHFNHSNSTLTFV